MMLNQRRAKDFRMRARCPRSAFLPFIILIAACAVYAGEAPFSRSSWIAQMQNRWTFSTSVLPTTILEVNVPLTFLPAMPAATIQPVQVSHDILQSQTGQPETQVEPMISINPFNS